METHQTILSLNFYALLYFQIILKEECAHSIIKNFKFPSIYFRRFLDFSRRIILGKNLEMRGCRLVLYGLGWNCRFVFVWPMVCFCKWFVASISYKFYIKIQTSGLLEKSKDLMMLGPSSHGAVVIAAEDQLVLLVGHKLSSQPTSPKTCPNPHKNLTLLWILVM